MEDIYTNLAARSSGRKGKGNLLGEISIKDLLNQERPDPSLVIQGLCHDLKKVLDHDGPRELAHALMELEGSLLKLEARFYGEATELPDLGEFHRNLSPMLLRTLLEHGDETDRHEDLMQGWKEAIRIAVEEELYLWQEKIGKGSR